jgi:uncharacterized membrane protein YgdD (TMEM256/DUF423 family)
VKGDRRLASLAALGLALSVALGAFGAHGLRGHFVEGGEELYRRATLYLSLASLGAGLLAAWSGQLLGEAAARRSALLTGGGALLFAGSLAALSLGGPRWLGAVAPVGGAAMVGGWVYASWALVGSAFTHGGRPPT